MNIIIRLAWRNVWRNLRRTVLTLLTIMVGCAMIIFINAMGKGGHDQMIEDSVAMNTGHLQIHEKGFWDNLTIDYAFQPSPELIRGLEDNKRISGYTERIIAGGLLYFNDRTRGALIQGIDPEREKRVGNLHQKIVPGGRYLNQDDSMQVVVGSTLAKNMGAEVNDTISMISQGFDGSVAADKFTIVGIFQSGNPEYDRELVLMPLSQAESTFTMMGYIHSIVIRLDDPSFLTEVKKEITSMVSMNRAELEVMGWDELMPELVQFIIMDDIGGYIFDFILFLVVAFGILNTIQMAVFERTREFGVMLSIGTRPLRIASMILMESVFITMIGIALGIALGTGISVYFQFNPIDYSRFSEEIAVWGFSTTVYPARVTPLNISVTSALTFLLAIIFSVFPAKRASKLDPVKAIRKL
ncbi:MAG TPA: ABC transporter permease [Desulfobacterales bacterium]|nr:ABC transporter permease [Desulfobacterales bacterium]